MWREPSPPGLSRASRSSSRGTAGVAPGLLSLPTCILPHRKVHYITVLFSAAEQLLCHWFSLQKSLRFVTISLVFIVGRTMDLVSVTTMDLRRPSSISSPCWPYKFFFCSLTMFTTARYSNAHARVLQVLYLLGVLQNDSCANISNLLSSGEVNYLRFRRVFYLLTSTPP